MNLDHATPELFAALAKAQGVIENATKSSINPHFRSKYADLAEVLNTVRPPFSENGLSIIQSTAFDGSLVSVTTVLGHASGGYLTSVASCVPAKTDAQGIGACTTYLRRYGAAAMGGIAQEDDDGQSAAHAERPAPVAKGQPLDGVWERLGEEEQAYLLTVRDEVLKRMDKPEFALAYLEGQTLDADEKAGLWTQFDSKTRSTLKKVGHA